jgi:hypothetical protein
VQDTLQTPDCAGIDHADFTADGRTAVFTCEFAGRVAVVDVSIRKIDVGKGHTALRPAPAGAGTPSGTPASCGSGRSGLLHEVLGAHEPISQLAGVPTAAAGPVR